LGLFYLIKPRIKVRLAELDIKQTELAEEFGVSKQTFNGWVTGRIKPSLEIAFRLAKRLDCKIEDLWSYDDEK
jgi:DNA-binding XRE family transcriptional regulator